MLCRAGLVNKAHWQLAGAEIGPAFFRSTIQGARAAAAAGDENSELIAGFVRQLEKFRANRQACYFCAVVGKPAARIFEA